MRSTQRAGLLTFGHARSGSGDVVERSAAPAAEGVFGVLSHPIADPGLAHLFDGEINVVFAAFEADLPVVPDGVTGPRVAVARLPDAAWVHNPAVSQVKFEREMGVPDADNIGLDVGEPLGPDLRLLAEVVVKRVPRGFSLGKYG